MAIEHPRRVLDIRDVALQLRSSESSIKRLVAAGHLRKPRHILTKPVWFQEDVDEYLRRLDHGEFEKV